MPASTCLQNDIVLSANLGSSDNHWTFASEKYLNWSRSLPNCLTSIDIAYLLASTFQLHLRWCSLGTWQIKSTKLYLADRLDTSRYCFEIIRCWLQSLFDFRYTMGRDEKVATPLVLESWIKVSERGRYTKGWMDKLTLKIAPLLKSGQGRKWVYPVGSLGVL